MSKYVKEINQALSLREPQLYSLEDLAWVANNISLEKNADPKIALRKITGRYRRVTDFERDFPSLCFALATGVGKTRLMGAAIAYLNIAKEMKHFFVLAPNLTIYNKLINDFTPATPKYVFNGLAKFATHPPEIITGDNYKKGVDLLRRGDDTVHINIFNISKIDASERGIKAVREVIGESYFKFLMGLPNLVMLMDESHRYRAKAAMKAINELKPVLGIELTATPQIETGSTKPKKFKNVIYEYELHQAMADEFVKEPAAATPPDFKSEDYTKKELEKVKLRDGIRLHEEAKEALREYAKNENKPLVKPFMLVIARDINHAEDLRKQIERDDFFNGNYKDHVITVHSEQTGAERDENVQKLLLLEDPKSKIEIVIHVNMLKEGWDVTNLYTIVPLRAGNSKTLVEQAVGRGLRLPYGKRTGVEAVDRLTIVAHEHFDAIINAAKENKFNFKSRIIDDDETPSKPVAIKPRVESIIADTATNASQEDANEISEAFLKTVEDIKDVPTTRQLADKENQKIIIKTIQDTIQSDIKPAKISSAVKQMTQDYITHTIDIPHIISEIKDSTSYKFESFTLDTDTLDFSESNEIMITSLVSGDTNSVKSGDPIPIDGVLKDLIVSDLWENRTDISYNDNKGVIHDLVNQMVAYVDSVHEDKTAVLDLRRFTPRGLANAIYAQMQLHRIPGGGIPENYVAKGFTRLATIHGSYHTKQRLSDKVKDRKNIKKVIFTDFKKNLYPKQKFDSEPEQSFSEILERTKEVIKWCKPLKRNLFIPYSSGSYHPDFVVETDTDKWICEVKAENRTNDPDVLAKRAAAIKWCEAASEYEKSHGGKVWNYALIEHDQIKPSSSFRGLVNSQKKQ